MKIKDIIRENAESDLDLFGKPGAFNAGIKKAIKQIEDPYLRTVRKVRELAKDKYGTTIRVSSVPKAAARGRATVWIGDYDSTNGSPEINPEAYEVKKDLEQMGFDSKFTGSGWLSIQVPPAFSDQLAEESDEELFGIDDPVLRALKLLMKLKIVVQRNPQAMKELLGNLNYVKGEDIGQVREKIFDFMAQSLGMPRDYFDQQSEELGMLPVTGNWYMRPYDFWNVQALNKDIKILKQWRQRESNFNLTENDESDDELFGDSGLSVSNIRRAVKQAVYDHLVRYGTHWARNGLDQFEEPFRLEQWLEDKEAPRDWNQGNQYASVSNSLDHYYARLDDDTQEEIFNDVNMMIRSIYQKED